MRIVERFSIIVFSLIVLFVSCFALLISIEVVDFDVLQDMAKVLNENVITTVCVSVLMCLWSIANIFFKSDVRNDNSNGVLLENENGSLLISRESITNLVESVIKKNNDIKDANVKIEFDSNKDLIINIVLSLKDNNIVIKSTSSKLQEDIKLTIKKTTDLEINSINIRIKNVEPEKEKKASSVQ